MITLEHSAITLLKLHGDVEQFREIIPYILEPDALRRYTGPRQYTHFEKLGDDVSWIEFPDDLKVVNKQNVFDYCKSHLAGEYPKCAIGEETQIDVFEKHNRHLKPLNYIGVKNHLIQDVDFDIFVRQVFDCTKRFKDVYVFDGLVINGQEMRKLVQKVSEFGLYRLAFLIYQTTGIKITQEWYTENVYRSIQKIYSQDLADGTYNYMKIPENMNSWIASADWSHFEEAPLTVEKYDRMYYEVLTKMQSL